MECDVADLHSVGAVAKQVELSFGRIDILVNNAGIGVLSVPLHELPPDDWDRMMNTNLRGVYYCIRSFAPLMIRSRSGHIINISSLAGKNALPNGAAYSASKWGLNGLTYSVAEELRAAQYSGLGDLSRIGAHRVQSTRREKRGQDASGFRRGACGGDDRDTGPAVVRERNSDAACAETVGRVRSGSTS